MVSCLSLFFSTASTSLSQRVVACTVLFNMTLESVSDTGLTRATEHIVGRSSAKGTFHAIGYIRVHRNLVFALYRSEQYCGTGVVLSNARVKSVA